MTTRGRTLVGIVLVVLVVTAGAAMAFTGGSANAGVQAQQESEPNDDRGNATPIETGPTVSGTADTDAADWFSFEATAEEFVRVEILAPLPGEIELIAPNGTILDAGNGITETEAIGANATQTSTYYVRITPSAGEFAFDYRFNVDRGTPDRFEPNDVSEEATPIALDAQPTATITESGNVDWYAVELTAGQRLVARLDRPNVETSLHNDVALDIVAPNGTGIGEIAFNTIPPSSETGFDQGYDGPVTQRATADEAGTYYVRVSGIQGSGAPGASSRETKGFFTYNLDLNATGGQPTTTTTPTTTATETTTTETETEEEADTPTASVTFDNQTTDGTTVTVESVTLSEGGFVAIHNASLLDGNTLGSVVGVSEPLSAGTHENVEVTLFDVPGQGFAEDMTLEENQPLIAMPHLDTNGNGVYDFITSGGEADGPYTADGSAVVDPASITIEQEMGGDDGAAPAEELGQNDADDDGDGHLDEDGEDGNDVPSNDDDDGDGAIDEDDEPDDGDDGSDDFNGNAEDDDDGDGHLDEDDEDDGGNSDDEDNDGDGAVDEDDEPDNDD